MGNLIDPDPPQTVQQIHPTRALPTDAIADPPTDRQLTRINKATADFDVCTANQQT